MELTHEFKVAVPVERAWATLLDVERIAPCLPGAQLQEIEGDEYRGVVKVKVGPITAQYKGKATFVERDESSHKAILRAEGRDTRGQGNANATITASLSADGDGTVVNIVTDLTITGRVAQLGRGVLADVSAKLLGDFVQCLEREVLSGDVPSSNGSGDSSATNNPAPAAPATAESTATPGKQAPSGARRVDQPEARPIDLLETAGAPLFKRLAPLVALLVVLLLLRRRRARRASSR